MASKHDAKRARESYWVMQQNLARQKGQQFWMQKPKQPKIAPKPAAAKPEPAEADAPLADEQRADDKPAS